MKINWRWLLLLAAIIGSIEYVDALKATSLIFGRGPNGTITAKTTTTTTTTTTSISPSPTTTTTTIVPEVSGSESNDETETEIDEETGEVVTKPTLTGIPQIDYIWDPNLPRELNGYNLSSYPFLNSVPDEHDIDFKCDGLHDGFYASIKYNCQLYHHCVYGIRHDFLCANFTAFDQKSFICHFVSEVNCKNSAKYWFRNDALYKATTTTSTTTTTLAPPPTSETTPYTPLRRPNLRSRPLRRRRPQQEYYYDDYEEYDDDYVEDRMNRRKKLNRQRTRRPEYDDEYVAPRGHKEDDDELYEQRSTARTRTRDGEDDYEYDRRHYERPRNRHRPGNKRRYHDDDLDKRNQNEGRQYSDNDQRKPTERRNTDDRRAPLDDRRIDDRRIGDDRRSSADDRRSSIDDRRSDERRVPTDDRRSTNDDSIRRPYRRRPSDERRPSYDDDEPPRKHLDYHDEDERDRSHKNDPQEEKVEIVPKVRANNAGSSIFNRPRTAPRINRPVPINEKDKFQYSAKQNKQNQTPASAPALAQMHSGEEAYDEEYDYEVQPSKSQPTKEEKKTEIKSSSLVSSQKDPKAPEKETSQVSEVEEDIYEYDDEPIVSEKPAPPPPPPPAPVKPAYKRPEEENRTKVLANKQQFTSNSKQTETHKEVERDAPVAVEEDDVEYLEEDIPEEEEAAVNNKPKQQEVNKRLSAHTDREQSSIAKPNHTGPSATSTSSGPSGPSGPSGSSGPSGPASHFLSRNRFHRPGLSTGRDASRLTAPGVSNYDKQSDSEQGGYFNKDHIPESIRPSGFRMSPQNNDPQVLSSRDEPETTNEREIRPVIRVLKRPFLPSRGGNPYLSRGLKPLGSNAAFESTEYTPIDMETSTISGTRLLEHSPPIVRPNYDHNGYSSIQTGPRTTQQPQIEPPRSTLDDIYNEEYDVTLNDALNPTLKPLTQTRGSPIGFSASKYDRINPYARADISYSPSQLRNTHNGHFSLHSRPQRGYQPSLVHEYYSDELDY